MAYVIRPGGLRGLGEFESSQYEDLGCDLAVSEAVGYCAGPAGEDLTPRATTTTSAGGVIPKRPASRPAAKPFSPIQFLNDYGMYIGVGILGLALLKGRR